jgi:predicted RND superfamily exporter protein
MKLNGWWRIAIVSSSIWFICCGICGICSYSGYINSVNCLKEEEESKITEYKLTKFKITDQKTGRQIIISGDQAPSPDDVEDIFESIESQDKPVRQPEQQIKNTPSQVSKPIYQPDNEDQKYFRSSSGDVNNADTTSVNYQGYKNLKCIEKQVLQDCFIVFLISAFIPITILFIFYKIIRWIIIGFRK